MLLTQLQPTQHSAGCLLTSSCPYYANTAHHSSGSNSASRDATVHELIDDNLLTTHFQPIVSLEKRSIYAFEALCRVIGPNPFHTIEQLFAAAARQNSTLQLDMHCRKRAIQLAASQSIGKQDALLFLNICPNSLLEHSHNTGVTEQFALQSGISKQQIVLEITEQEAVTNYTLFKKAIDHYRKRGFSIAIDDFGAGYGGLKMLSMLEPDYVKIDGHFFKDHQKSNINYNLIEAIATACFRIGIEVIAEGIETEHDMKICQEIGITLLQGYHFAKPAAKLCKANDLSLPSEPALNVSATRQFDEVICVGDIIHYEEPALASDKALTVLKRFQEQSRLQCLPVLKKGQICGLINRNRFMENHMVGRHGYGMNLNYYKKVDDLLEETYLQVPHYLSVEEVARKIHLRQQYSIYDDVCVTRSGKYIGIVAVSEILNAVTENSMMMARGANPLTGMPGNEFIQRQIAKMLSQSIHFDVCYLDIDNFKPFNDRHGFEVGDKVIKCLGEIASRAVQKFTAGSVGFAGHIGGDDFILITRPKRSIEICNHIVDHFTREGLGYHSKEDRQRGCYSSVDRQGEERCFELLSLSIGIVSTEIHHITSFAEISSIASDLKKRAKNMTGSAIVRDRRISSTTGNRTTRQ